MKNVFVALFYLIVCNFKLNAQTNTDAFVKLKAIEGSWVLKSENAVMTESWTFINDSLFEGSVRMIDFDGHDLFSEKLAIRKSKKSIYYIAAVSNQNDNKEIPFELKNSVSSVFVFENLSHDFPQRIVYDLSVKDKVSAYIEGDVKGKLKRTDFKFERVN